MGVIRSKKIYKIRKLIFHAFPTISIISFVTCIIFLGLVFIKTVSAQTEYETNGTIFTRETNCFIIYNIEVDNLVLISINPIEGGWHYSEVISPNQIQVGRIGTVGPIPGPHSYNFIANETGNYLLKIWTDDRYAFNYTVTSSHPIEGGSKWIPQEPEEHPVHHSLVPPCCRSGKSKT